MSEAEGAKQPEIHGKVALTPFPSLANKCEAVSRAGEIFCLDFVCCFFFIVVPFLVYMYSYYDYSVFRFIKKKNGEPDQDFSNIAAQEPRAHLW